MFYETTLDEALRFGDVVKGILLTSPDIIEPDLIKDYKIDIKLPDYCVIISPCCSIGDKVISLTPLIKLRNSFFDNPYFVKDLTNINRKMEPEQTLPPKVWDGLPQGKKDERLAEGRGYTFLDLFIYKDNPLFKKYTVNRGGGENIKTNYYMIDFKNIYKINCAKILSPTDSPLTIKKLQLSIQVRGELRDKLSYYYGRVPKEDKIKED